MPGVPFSYRWKDKKVTDGGKGLGEGKSLREEQLQSKDEVQVCCLPLIRATFL